MATNKQAIATRSIKLRNDASECSRLYAFLAECFSDLSIAEDIHHDLKLVSEEILSNIIRHGYDSAQTAEVVIEFIATENSISLSFRDTGNAFNPLDTNRQSVGEDLSEGGMGFHLVRSLTDKQEYERKDDTNVFTVTKHYN